MESYILDQYHSCLARHPLFRGLDSREAAALSRYYSILRIPPSADFLYPGDSDDSLYILLEGHVTSGSSDGGFVPGAQYYPGDFWGLDSLLRPDRYSLVYRSREQSVLVRFKAEGFRRMLKDFPGIALRFRPRTDGQNHLVTGFPSGSWKHLKDIAARKNRKGALVHYQGRTSRKTFSISLTVPVLLISSGLLLLPLSPFAGIPAVAGMLYLGAELFLRNLTLYRVTDREAVKRFFNWRTFRRDQEIVPLDQIQSVTVSVRGPVRSLLKIGDLEVHTAGPGLVFRRIDHPRELQKKLMELRGAFCSEEKGREREALREMISRRFSPGTCDEVLFRGDRTEDVHTDAPDRMVFRKSPARLVLKLAVPAAGLVCSLFLPWLLPPGDGFFIRWIPVLLDGTFLFRILWIALDWWNDIYKIELPYLWDIERKPFGKEDIRRQTELGLVLNVTARQKGAAGLLLNYGDVIIETAGRDAPLIFYSVTNPFRVQKDLLRYRDLLLRRREEQGREKSREDLLEFSEILKQTRNRERICRKDAGPTARKQSI